MAPETATGVDVRRLVIGADELRTELSAGSDVVVLEVWRDDAGAGRPRIPGARTVALTVDLVGTPSAASGNLPLPSAEQIQEVVRRWSINPGSIVVAYSPEHPALAARAWWTLTWAGVPDVRVLDGDAAHWTGPPAAHTPPGTGTFTVRIGSLPTLDTEEAAALARSGVLLDARALTAYVGESGGGHIPGAVSLPAGAVVDDDGRLADDEHLRERYRTAGVEQNTVVGAYCGGGTSATWVVLSLAKIGITAALYPGSFSAYSADGDRPVATGPDRG